MASKRAEILETAHSRMHDFLIAYIQRHEAVSEEKAKQLFDELSMIHGKVVALKKNQVK